jgi:hypothetical protein
MAQCVQGPQVSGVELKTPLQRIDGCLDIALLSKGNSEVQPRFREPGGQSDGLGVALDRRFVVIPRDEQVAEIHEHVRLSGCDSEGLAKKPLALAGVTASPTHHAHELQCTGVLMIGLQDFPAAALGSGKIPRCAGGCRFLQKSLNFR